MLAMKQRARPPFHLAFPVHDLAEAREFYGQLLGCPMGRSTDAWIDFDLMGHQIVAHLAPEQISSEILRNPVDGEQVPVRHFGLVLEWDEWHSFAARMRGSGVKFLIEPSVRFAGETGEQATLFLRDPSGNALEFKSFRDPAQLFAKDKL